MNDNAISISCTFNPLNNDSLCPQITIPPQTLFVVGILFSRCPCVLPCVRASVRPSVTLCFLNILKSHCWIFIKPCKHVHICKTNTLLYPRKLCLWWVYCFHVVRVCVRPCVRLSVHPSVRP